MIPFVHLIWSVKCCWIALTRLLNFKWPQQQHHGTNTPKWHKASVIIWILFPWSTTKNYCTVRMHISSHSICVCVRVSHTVCVFQLASMPGFISMWLTCLLHASLYMQSRIYFPNGIRLWPPVDPPFLGHDTRSTVQEERVTCSVHAHDCKTQRMHWRACPHKCVPPFACSWELQQKEWGGFRTWSALLPMGWGDKCVCVRESVCVHLWQQTFIVQRGPLPWLQGFIALKNTDHTEHLVTVTSHWQSCRLKQTDTQNGVMMMKEDVRQTGSNAQLCVSQASVLVFTGLFSPRVIRNSFTPNS